VDGCQTGCSSVFNRLFLVSVSVDYVVAGQLLKLLFVLSRQGVVWGFLLLFTVTSH